VRVIPRRPRVVLFVVALASGAACAPAPEAPAPMAVFPDLSGPYLGQTPPGPQPQLFAPGIISTGLGELNSVFTPDGKEFYYSVDIGPDWVIMVTRQTDAGWTTPEVAPFTREHSGVDLCISADGERLLFCSDRPRPGRDVRGPMDIWMVQRTADGAWSEPVNLEKVNSDGAEFYPTLTADGTLYFVSSREGSAGGTDVYRSRLVDGSYTEPENVGPVINSPGRQGDTFVAPDESYIILNSSGHERGPEGGSLFITFRGEDGAWSPPRNLGEVMAADRSDFCPMMSPDGRYFFFSSARSRFGGADGRLTWAGLIEAQSRPENGGTDIYWMDAGFVERLRPAPSP
jgi:Tol biopolymer transport system component